MKKILIGLLLISFVALIFSYTQYQKKIEATGNEAKNYLAEREMLKQEKMQAETAALVESIEGMNLPAENFINTQNSIIEDLQNGESVTIVFLGDSTTEQNQYTGQEPGHVKLISNQLISIFGEKIKVINQGVSGNTSGDMLKRVESSVLKHKPDYVIVSSGINDSVNENLADAFDKNIEKIITSIADESDAKIFLRSTNPTLGEDLNNVIQKELNPSLKNLAQKYELGYIDAYSQMKIDIPQADLKKYMTDIYHPNAEGQRVIANIVLYGLFAENN